jgi:hypothetical protein
MFLFVYLLFLIVFICVLVKLFKKDSHSYTNSCYQSPMDNLVKQREEANRNLQLKKNRDLLNNQIINSIAKSSSYEEKNVYKSVLNDFDDTQEAYEHKKWLYNNGNLRTDKEIEDWNYQHGGFEKDLKKPKWYIWIWIISCFAIGFSLEQDEFGFIIAFVIAVFTSFIPITIYCCSTTSKLKKARKHGVSPRDPKFIDASVKAGIAAAGAASTLHASSKGIKNLTK